MKKVKKKFNNTEEMLSFLKGIRKRTSESLQQLKEENKKYDKLLKEEASSLKEAEVRYKPMKK
jgi:gas vesicle protein